MRNSHTSRFAFAFVAILVVGVFVSSVFESFMFGYCVRDVRWLRLLGVAQGGFKSKAQAGAICGEGDQ